MRARETDEIKDATGPADQTSVLLRDVRIDGDVDAIKACFDAVRMSCAGAEGGLSAECRARCGAKAVECARALLDRERSGAFDDFTANDGVSAIEDAYCVMFDVIESCAGASGRWTVKMREDAAAALTQVACRALGIEASSSGDLSAYCPPHARGTSSAHDLEYALSGGARVRCAAARALTALAKVNGKSLHGAWRAMFPTAANQLHIKSISTSIVKPIACDASAHVRCAAASAISAALEGPASSQYLAMASYTETNSASTRVRSFSPLSATLGDMVVTTLRALLLALASEPSAMCIREQCKAIGALCDAAPLGKFRSPLLREALEGVYARLSSLDAEIILHERAMVRNALFSALSAVLSAQGASAALDGVLSANASDIVSTMIGSARGIAHAGSKCEAYCALRALAAGHIAHLTALDARTLRKLFPSAVCASGGGADDRLCQASARLLTEYLGAVSGCLHVKSDTDEARAGAPTVTPAAMPVDALRHAWLDAIESQLPVCAAHKSPLVRVAGLGALHRINANVIDCLANDASALGKLLSMPHVVLTSGTEPVPAVRAAACGVLGTMAYLPCTDLENTAAALLVASRDASKSVQIPTSWALANVAEANAAPTRALCDATIAALARTFIESAANEHIDKVRANAARGIGHLLSSIEFENTDSSWLLDASHALASCLTTGNAKTQWNACLAVAALFRNASAMERSTSWSTYVVRMLLLLIRDASNFKIRMHASAALGACQVREHLGLSFADAVVVLASSLNALLDPNASSSTSESNQTVSVMDFKYKQELVDTLASTLTRIIALAGDDDASRIGAALAPYEFTKARVTQV